MTDWTEQRIGYAFGLLGGGLTALGGLVTLIVGTTYALFGHPLGIVGAVSEAAVLFVVGGLAMFFAWLVRHDWSTRPLAGGLLLVVLAFAGWAILGLGVNVLALVGSLFVLLAGVLFLVEPAKRAASALVTST
jgi:hypothetical protein